MLQGKLDRVAQTLFDGIHLRIPRHDRVHLVGQDLLHQIGDVAIVVIERFPVDAAPLHNIFNGDVVQGALLQQGGEGFLDCPPCEICHGAGLLSIAYIIIACVPKKTKTGF